MNEIKNTLRLAIVFAVLAVLVYLQFRTWQELRLGPLSAIPSTIGVTSSMAVRYIYIAYLLRAIRWKIFLRPVRKEASILGLVAADPDWIYRTCDARAAGRIDSSLPDRSPSRI